MVEVKTIHEETVICPHCEKRIDVKLKKETITPAEKGEYNKFMEVEKSTQKTLHEV